MADPDAAKAEFLGKGFQPTPLRKIVKTAGVTTGAYSSKEELFEAIEGELYRYFMDCYCWT